MCRTRLTVAALAVLAGSGWATAHAPASSALPAEAALVVDVSFNGTADTQTKPPGSFADLTVIVTNNTGLPLTNLVAASGVPHPASIAFPATYCPQTKASMAVGEVWQFTCRTARADNAMVEYVSVWADSPEGVWADSDTTVVDRPTLPYATLDLSVDGAADTQEIVPGTQPTYRVRFTAPDGLRNFDNITFSDPLAPDCDRAFTDQAPGTVFDYTCTGPAASHSLTNGINVTYDVGSYRRRLSDMTEVVVPPVMSTLTVTKHLEGDGVAPAGGWEVTVSSSNCELPGVLTTLTIPAAGGTVVFENLRVTAADRSPCRYDLAETTVDGWTPTFTPTGPYTVNEGTSVQIDLLNSSPTTSTTTTSTTTTLPPETTTTVAGALPTPTGSVVGAGAGAGAGQLPATGSDTPVVPGAVLIGAGAALLGLARRRHAA